MSGPLSAQDAENEAAAPDVTSEAEIAPQPQNTIAQIPLIAFDRERIFENTDIGRALEAKVEALLNDLVIENDTIFASLEAEEQELTELKNTLSKEDFAKKAEAFDEKVIAIRAEQKAKSEAIEQTRDQGLRAFEDTLNVVLKDIAQEVRAVAVFERTQIYLMSGSIDISLEVIKRLNASSQQAAEAEALAQDPQPAAEDQ
ncbi:OmpH family outer membrane protein [Pacificibacter sp. 1_MG-2023]|uniref:OmpH family outer membrane protein n=1 Tax=Pacificibacter sp. 1_MG-2023 TaxID=3062658 RepID=UPI0026E14B4A|nr:OmpH family outer membrane protein [Pacificibacter sp. 1_MG-2023]MBU2936857.1 OmpH family outer membrane protein [Pacificibacter marinus]MDO6614850.1 OmpH family outer membrane protein [Pacificibacter sp. 1_MG-2023]